MTTQQRDQETRAGTLAADWGQVAHQGIQVFLESLERKQVRRHVPV